MTIYSGFLFVLLIQPFSFVPINKDCSELNQRSLFIEQKSISEIPGPGSCRGCEELSMEKLMNSPSICEEQHSYRIQLHHKGMEHLKSSLSILHRSILIGGYWTISNFVWNPAINHQCNLQKVDMCLPESWDHHNNIIISCFENQIQLLNWSQKILNITHDIQQIIPNSEIDIENLLPFPNLFNVTIVDIQPAQLCQKLNSIVCHKRMDQNDNNQCSFYFCHTTNTSELISITLKYEKTKTHVTLLMMCHPLTTQQIKQYQTVIGDQLCHFLRPQTSFFLCDKE